MCDLIAMQSEALGLLRPQEEEQPHDDNTPWEELTESERAALRAEWGRRHASPAVDGSDPRQADADSAGD